MSHLNFLNLAFSTNLCPIKIALSGNSVWPKASDYQKLAKMLNETFSVIFKQCELSWLKIQILSDKKNIWIFAPISVILARYARLWELFCPKGWSLLIRFQYWIWTFYWPCWICRIWWIRHCSLRIECHFCIDVTGMAFCPGLSRIWSLHNAGIHAKTIWKSTNPSFTIDFVT